MSTTLSVIAPVYKVEEYLRRFVESILSQSFTDFELILVDDGSPDHCGEIIDEYSKKESRIITIHQKNSGCSSARNAGLAAASGEFVLFADPDDWIKQDMLRVMIEMIRNTKSDLCCCGWTDYFQNNEYRNHMVTNEVCVWEQETFVTHLFDIPRTVNGSTCLGNKLLKREIIKELFDKTLPMYEDALFLLQYCRNIKNAVVIPQCYYNYCHRANSLSHNDVLNNSKFVNIRRRFINIAQDIGRDCARNAEADYLDACWRFYNLARNSQDEKTRLRLEHELLDYLGAQMRGVIINPYLSWKLKFIIIAWFVNYSKRNTH